MTEHLRRLTRREFLRGSLAAAAAMAAPVRLLRAAASAPAAAVDPNRFALLADTHVATDPAKVAHGARMAEHLAQAVRQVLALSPRPAGVIVNGDCAYHQGLRGDYEQLAGIVKPLADAKVPLHLLVGNHDHRENLYAAVPGQRPAEPPVAGRHVAVLPSPRANWFLLDSLDKTNQTAGALGAEQLAWLAGALDERADKPAIVLAHHNLQLQSEVPEGQKLGGLRDTRELLDVLLPRRQVKAFLYGHWHQWRQGARGDLPVVGLPAVAYTFSPDQPSAWVLADVKDGGVTLELRCLDAAHKLHGDKLEVAWRR